MAWRIVYNKACKRLRSKVVMSLTHCRSPLMQDTFPCKPLIHKEMIIRFEIVYFYTFTKGTIRHSCNWLSTTASMRYEFKISYVKLYDNKHIFIRLICHLELSKQEQICQIYILLIYVNVIEFRFHLELWYFNLDCMYISFTEVWCHIQMLL